MPSLGIEPNPRPSQGRVRIRHTPRTAEVVSCRLSAVSEIVLLTTDHRSLKISRPGLEPGPGASEAPMQSATPSGQTGRSNRTTSLRPQVSGLKPASARARGFEPRRAVLEAA